MSIICFANQASVLSLGKIRQANAGRQATDVMADQPRVTADLQVLDRVLAAQAQMLNEPLSAQPRFKVFSSLRPLIAWRS